MSESRKTLAFVGAALACVLLAWATTPRRAASAADQERGRPFFPDFTDPNAATSLEVVEFDEQTSVAKPFKVLNRDGRWTIPSHDNYPADAGTRLASVAASIVALRKDDVASENPSDAERCGVVDPADETLPTTRGRGTRLTVRGVNEKVLADVIVGKAVEGRPNFRYVRVPDQTRTYVARIDRLDVSTDFEDWIERNVLLVAREDIDQIVIRNYATEAGTGRVTQREMIVLRKEARDRWTAAGMAAGEAVDTYTMNLLVTKLVELVILDVRRKPPSVTAMLTGASPERRFLQSDVADLAAKGFYFTADGQLLSNQGEVVVHTSSGIFYVLRFGEVVSGAPDSRYVFISVGFDAAALPGPRPDAVRRQLDILRARFAPWYYLVANDNFRKIRVSRAELIKPRAAARG
jgi:hypothetical protein